MAAAPQTRRIIPCSSAHAPICFRATRSRRWMCIICSNATCSISGFGPVLPSPARGAEEVSAAQPDALHLARVAGRLAGLAFFEKRGVLVVEILQLDPLHFAADEPLDGMHV